MSFAVVGHVEWISFVQVAQLPQAGQIVPAEHFYEEVGGGGAVAAVQMARLAGGAHFFTALGDDEIGHRCHERLQQLGLTVHVAWRQEPQRRGIVFIDGNGERTITVIGPRIVPESADQLPWHLLDECRGCYFTGGSVVQARRAQFLLATTRIREMFSEDQPDGWVGSSQDAREQVDSMPGSLLVMTRGGEGGQYWTADGNAHGWEPTSLPGELVDTYGCGDSFAGALAYGLGSALPVAEAVNLAARCGAACLCGRGPYAGQITV